MTLERWSPLTRLKRALEDGTTTPVDVAAEVAARANGNASTNTYIGFDGQEVMERAEALGRMYPPSSGKPALFSVPISLKDCFDLAGKRTTCAARFYAEHHEPAAEDSAMAERLRASGALITGKTHMHALAYGITGQNPDYGDCLQPRDGTLLTGGSSSGAAASVQEGSALAAIGTDTGGSVRVPAALCGLVGYRASHGLASPDGVWPQAWRGAAHLAASFDTVGILLRDPRDAAPIANALFGVPFADAPVRPRVGCVSRAFLEDSEPEVLDTYSAWRRRSVEAGAVLSEFDAAGWEGAQEIFAAIQAHEAAELHRGYYDEFEPAIAQRLHWGASLTEADLKPLRERHAAFRVAMSDLLERYDFLMLPSAPVSRLKAADDQASARPRILRYTTPFSLAGLPAVTLPGEMIGAGFGTGVQIGAAAGADGALLAWVAELGERVANGSA